MQPQEKYATLLQICKENSLGIVKNYAKSQFGLFTCVIAKVTLFTFLQYINMKKERELNRIRYSLGA